MVTAKAQNNHTVTRNSSFFKRMPETAIPLQMEEEIDDTMANQHPLQANQPAVRPVNQPSQPINQQPLTVNQPPQPTDVIQPDKIDQPARLADFCLS